MIPIVLLGFFSTVEKVVAVVEDSPILLSEVNDGVTLFLLQYPFLIEDTTELRERILEQLINQRILKVEAERETIEVDKGRLENEVEAMLSLIKSQLDTLPELKLILKEKGFTISKLEEMLYQQLYAKYAGQMLLAKKGMVRPYVSPKEVERFYHENKDSIAIVPGRVKLAHILFLIKPSSKKEKEALHRILEVYDILQRGGDFEVVAKSFSEDLNTKYKGGLLGWVKKGEFLPELDTLIFNLNKGDFSQPARSRDGYHIFKLEDKRKERVLLRHIFIQLSLDKRDTLGTLNKAKEVYREIIKNPQRFEEYVKRYSEDFQTRDKGGEIGEFLIEGLSPPFDSVVNILEKGDISPPFVSQFGVHIVKILDKQERKLRSFEELREEIKFYLMQKKQEEALQELIESAKKKIYVIKKE